MTVIDTTGIHRIHYRFCGCDRSDKANNLVQFLRNGWYPASITDPDTCATFKVLDLFCQLNIIGNMNARDFMTSLERLTDATAGTGLKWLPASTFHFYTQPTTSYFDLYFGQDRYKTFTVRFPPTGTPCGPWT
jgi:hypothetical protein